MIGGRPTAVARCPPRSMICLWHPSDSARTATLIAGVVALLALFFAVPAHAATFEPLVVDSPLQEKIEEGQGESVVSLSAKSEQPAAGPRVGVQPTFLGWPSDGALESGFKWRWGKQHEGVDIDGETGDPIAAAAVGRVTMAESYYGYGLTVELTHSGVFSGIKTRYSHLSRMDADVGDRVERGEIIGLMGTTGSVTGSHLHFEVHDSDGPFDPMDLLVDRGGAES